jgi:hypothetical protein
MLLLAAVLPPVPSPSATAQSKSSGLRSSMHLKLSRFMEPKQEQRSEILAYFCLMVREWAINGPQIVYVRVRKLAETAGPTLEGE